GDTSARARAEGSYGASTRPPTALQEAAALMAVMNGKSFSATEGSHMDTLARVRVVRGTRRGRALCATVWCGRIVGDGPRPPPRATDREHAERPLRGLSRVRAHAAAPAPGSESGQAKAAGVLERPDASLERRMRLEEAAQEGAGPAYVPCRALDEEVRRRAVGEADLAGVELEPA